MKLKALLAALAAVSAAVPAGGQEPAFSPDAFRAHVAFLADDLLEGREAGTRGYDLAARYVATRFEALGLEPAAGGDWYQQVPFAAHDFAAPPRITVGDVTLTHGEGIAFSPRARAGDASFEAPVVFVGHGLVEPASGIDDYAGLDVTGRIVVATSGAPDSLPSDISAHLSGEKARIAAERGAAGLIMIRPRLPHGFRGRASVTWIDREGAPFAEAPGLRFVASIGQEQADRLFAGSPRPLEGTEGFALGLSARVEQRTAESRFASPNVVALLPGGDPAVAEEYVLLMAHLDGLGIREDGEGDRIRNGAMDNATGVATLIEVARRMQEDGNRPRRSILFAAVTAEEKGLLGAEYLAHNPVGSGRVVAVVNLDMPVLTYDFRDVIAFGAEHSTLGPITARAAARMDVAVSPDPLPQERLFTRSDHYPFVRRGVPSVFLMTGFANGGRERFTSFLRERYHSPSDDMSLPFDWDAGAKFARLNYLIAREIADAPEAPLWYEDSFFGATFGGAQPRAQRPAG